MFSVQYSVFQHIGLMHEQYQFCPWCYEDMSMVLSGADPEGGAPGARPPPPPNIGKNMIFLRKS